jgi:hypothetical protein
MVEFFLFCFVFFIITTVDKTENDIKHRGHTKQIQLLKNKSRAEAAA